MIQNVFSNNMLGHDLQGNAVCVHAMPTQYEHLELSADEETGHLRIVCPHWHWERGAPFVVKGRGKTNTPLWPRETAYLEAISKVQNTENPFQSLRLGEQVDNEYVGHLSVLLESCAKSCASP